MGFTHVGSAPLFAPHRNGDVFLTDNYEEANPALAAKDTVDEVVRQLSSACAENGLAFVLDVVMDQVAADGDMARSAERWFAAPDDRRDTLDPRWGRQDQGRAVPRFDTPEIAGQLCEWWTDRLVRLARAGAAGFRLLGLDSIPSESLRHIVDAVRAEVDCSFLAWTPGLAWSRLPALTRCVDGVFSSTAWWDGRASWFAEEYELLRGIAPPIAVVEAPFGERLAARVSSAAAIPGAYRRALWTAAATGNGFLMPMGFEFAAARAMHRRLGHADDVAEARTASEFDFGAEVYAANTLAEEVAAHRVSGEMRMLTGPGHRITALLRTDAMDAREAKSGLVVLINPDAATAPLSVGLDPLGPEAGAAFGRPKPLDGGGIPTMLEPDGVRLVAVERVAAVALRQQPQRSLAEALKAPRVIIDNTSPAVDGGRFAAKRVVGETIVVETDAFTDGHDVIGVELCWKAADEKDWRRVPMTSLGNDRWQASFTPARVGRHVMTIEAWRDDYATLCRDITLKHEAGVDISLEIEEARRHLEAAAAGAEPCTHGRFPDVLTTPATSDIDARVAMLTAPATRAAIAAIEERAFVATSPPLPLDIERPQAAFASWYELFPRSQTDDPARHGTFDDVIARLADIRAMGFDVLYFPPIHPIGKTNRKGPNNSLRAGPGDLGSPYAIGGEEGGHTAIHPALGTIEDFRRLVAAARQHGLEIALDFAIQCSPDHPWLREQPGWFRWRPDGSIRFAENPPKKYEDIVSVDFYAGTALPDLWIALRDTVLFWVREGVRLFRVDNPHTKPLPFWKWLIADVRGRDPNVVFLSEAFTRPKMMYRLAKIGFSQSYTYFTWRNTKQEMADYLVELTTTEVKEFFRPHFFVNTPDINPHFLQTSGRPGFLIRAALAATLSGLWGVYAGFELCEAAALPGREEYLDSEKYQIRVRRPDTPGNIIAEITLLNRIRRANPALHTHLGLRFYQAFNDQVLVYGKMTPGREDMILVAVSFDPRNVQTVTFELPLWEWKLPDDGSLAIEDLMRGHRFVWSGKHQQIRLDPDDLPFAIWRIAPLPGRAP